MKPANLATLEHVEIADCGCPEETYLFNGVFLQVHYDAADEADAFMDWGDDGQAEFSVRDAVSRFAARLAVFDWAARMTAWPVAA